MTRVIWLSIAIACGSSDPEPDAAVGTDSGATDAADVATDAGSGAATCAECTSAVAMFGVERIFDVAYFGDNTDGSLRIELHGEAAPGCPTATSPTPARTLVLPIIPSQTGSGALGSAVLFDFEGALTNEPLLRFESGSFELSGYEAQSSATGTVDISFDGGTIRGPFAATHCESLDE